MSLSNYLQWILERTVEAQNGAEEPFWIETSSIANGRAEAVVFIKPEITSAGADAVKQLIELTSRKFAEWEVEVSDIGVLGWRYLEDRNLMGAHYGVINRVSRDGLDALSAETKSRLTELGWAKERVFGGHQFLSQFPDFTAATLSVLWDNLNTSSVRIAPGTYAIRVQVLSEYLWLLNGFHPYQLEHFNAPGKAIIVMSVKSDSDWGLLRGSMIGETDPAKAEPESVRAILMSHASEWGVPVVNKGLNGIHLSAGPLEGMVELVRFKALPEGQETVYLATNFGAQLDEALGHGAAAHFAKNPILLVDGGEISAFDATEGKNPLEAVAILRQNYP